MATVVGAGGFSLNVLCGCAYLQALVSTLVLFPWIYEGAVCVYMRARPRAAGSCVFHRGSLTPGGSISHLRSQLMAFSGCPLLTLVPRADVNTAQIQSDRLL